LIWTSASLYPGWLFTASPNTEATISQGALEMLSTLRSSLSLAQNCCLPCISLVFHPNWPGPKPSIIGPTVPIQFSKPPLLFLFRLSSTYLVFCRLVLIFKVSSYCFRHVSRFVHYWCLRIMQLGFNFWKLPVPKRPNETVVAVDLNKELVWVWPTLFVWHNWMHLYKILKGSSSQLSKLHCNEKLFICVKKTKLTPKGLCVPYMKFRDFGHASTILICIWIF
jgi:hypothetical protein